MADNCWCGISFCKIDDDEDEDDEEDKEDPLDEFAGVGNVDVVDDGGCIEVEGVACNDGNIEFVSVANNEVGAEIGANSFVLVKLVVRVDVDDDVSLVGTYTVSSDGLFEVSDWWLWCDEEEVSQHLV